MEWPEYIKKWHKSKLRLVTEAQPNIEEILVNVNKPWHKKDECVCGAIRENLRKRGWNGKLPETHGHIMFTGREYKGPNRGVLNVCAGNTPQQSRYDLKWAWKRMQVPDELQHVWDKENGLKRCVKKQKWYDTDFPKTWMAYQLRNDLKGMVIGPIDKNKGELWTMCPILYQQAWDKTYNENTGYKEQCVGKWKRTMKKDEENVLWEKIVSQDTQRNRKNTGGEKDLIKYWEAIYKKKGWDEYARFETRGQLNVPYVLLKQKNIEKRETRDAKFDKTRPIAPQTRHPMKKLFHLAGRAWAFLANEIQGEHFIIPHGGKVPEFLQDVTELQTKGELTYVIKDIEGCYPHMPKEIIRFAMRDMVEELKRVKQYEAVEVPGKKTEKCRWKCRRKTARGRTVLPLQVLLDIMEFALDNTYIKDKNGNIFKQEVGIPMGDPHSPGMAIITCAWMEKEWMRGVAPEVKRFFKIKRFMDDILCFYVRNDRWDYQKFIEDLCRSEVYVKPLTLEDGKAGTFLETSFHIRNNTVEHWLKNDNDKETKIWRYNHFHSHGTFVQKRAILTACLRKVQKMASNRELLISSGRTKLREFQNLAYPNPILKGVCTFLAATTGNDAWIAVRNTIQ